MKERYRLPIRKGINDIIENCSKGENNINIAIFYKPFINQVSFHSLFSLFLVLKRIILGRGSYQQTIQAQKGLQEGKQSKRFYCAFLLAKYTPTKGPPKIVFRLLVSLSLLYQSSRI